MTIDELRERIKNEVILHEGGLADWQWRQKGLVTEAEQLGITDFTRLVNDVSRSINSIFGRIIDLKIRIQECALLNNKQLSDAEKKAFAEDAVRLQLAKVFVTEQWIPSILATLPEPSKSNPPLPSIDKKPVNVGSVLDSMPKVAHALVGGVSTSTLQVDVKAREIIRQKVQENLKEKDKHIFSKDLRILFQVLDYDEGLIAEEIRGYLSASYYEPVNNQRGDTLKEKLISTDWRHLSWRSPTPPSEESVLSGVPSVSPVSSSLAADQKPNEVPSVDVPAARPVSRSSEFKLPESRPINHPGGRTATKKTHSVALESEPATFNSSSASPKRSDSNRSLERPRGLSDYTIIGMAAAATLLVIWLVMWMVRTEDKTTLISSNEAQKGSKRKVVALSRRSPRRERVDLQSAAELPRSSTPVIVNRVPNEQNRTDEGFKSQSITKPVDPKPISENRSRSVELKEESVGNGQSQGNGPSGEPNADREKPVTNKQFDEIVEPVGELGERLARKKGRWGYIDKNGKWLIPAQYDDATPFHNGRATVVLDGQTFEIGSDGKRIRD